jgi:hypothetical protein
MTFSHPQVESLNYFAKKYIFEKRIKASNHISNALLKKKQKM